MSYADKMGFPFVVLLGEDEINEGVVALKNMRSGEQVKVSATDAADTVIAAVSELNSGAVIKE